MSFVDDNLKIARAKAKEIWYSKQTHHEATDWDKAFSFNNLPCGKKTFINVFTMGFMEGRK